LPTPLLVALVALACYAGCRGDAGEPVGGSPDGVTFVGGRAVVPEEYAVDGEAVDLAGHLTILANGFPVHEDAVFGRRRAGASLRKRLTPALVSGENVAAYEVVPFLSRTAGGVAARPVRFTMWVEAPDGSEVGGTRRGVAASDSAFAAWERALAARWAGWAAAEDSLFEARPALLAALADSVASDPHAGAYGVGPALDSARAWSQANPVRVATSFVRPGGVGRPSDGAPSFDAVFREAPVIQGTPADSARLRAYAVRLRDLIDARDGSAVYDEFAVSVDHSFEFRGVAPPPRDSLRALWALDADGDEWFFSTGGGVESYEASDVMLRSWAGGRVWELYREGADGLLQAPPRAVDAATVSSEVYIGAGPNGRLRVVRQ
jgi:hypothetical protein